jgi:hypothetical protein
MRWVGEAMSISPIDDRGPDPCGSSMATPVSYSAPITEPDPSAGTPKVSGAGQLCESPPAQGLPAFWYAGHQWRRCISNS